MPLPPKVSSALPRRRTAVVVRPAVVCWPVHLIRLDGPAAEEARPDGPAAAEAQLVRHDRPAARGRRDPLYPIWLIEAGTRFIATNPDVTTPSVEGPLPATGSVAALITAVTGRNPHSVMVGDRMDTDAVAGIEAGLDTILAFTGSTTVAAVEKYSYRPAASWRPSPKPSTSSSARSLPVK
jgi:hypothetical protein